jgi:hypothetical protein
MAQNTTGLKYVLLEIIDRKDGYFSTNFAAVAGGRFLCFFLGLSLVQHGGRGDDLSSGV